MKKKNSSKERKKPIYDVDLKFNDDAEEESYKRYKHRCYRYLILKALLFFFLGLFFAVFVRILVCVKPQVSQGDPVSTENGFHETIG